MFGYTSTSFGSINVELPPGQHKLKVLLNGAEKKPLTITFSALAGHKYELYAKIHKTGNTWEASIFDITNKKTSVARVELPKKVKKQPLVIKAPRLLTTQPDWLLIKGKDKHVDNHGGDLVRIGGTVSLPGLGYKFINYSGLLIQWYPNGKIVYIKGLGVIINLRTNEKVILPMKK